MKRKTFIAAALFFTIIFSGISSYSLDGEKVGKIGEVNKKTKEIIVESSEVQEKIQIGTKLYVRIDDKVVIMEATYPMQTVAKCKLAKSDAAYLPRIKKGQEVFLYIEGVEQKEEEATADNPGKVRASRIIGKHKIDDFTTFLGLKKGDRIDRAYKLFGKPDEVENKSSKGYDFDGAYWNSGNQTFLTIHYKRETKRITGIYLRVLDDENEPGETVKKFFSTRGIKDKKMTLLGADKSSLLDMLGEGEITYDGEHSITYEFKLSIKGYNAVSFNIWKETELCEEISIYWGED